MLTLHDLGPQLPELARRVLESYLSTGLLPSTSPSDAPPAPVFVSLHDLAHGLRGCIGTLTAQRADVLEETAHNAVSAATRDPRFKPVTRKELDRLVLDVTVLHPLEAIHSSKDLEPKRYGVVVRDSEGRQGVLLPDLPGIDNIAEQVRIAKQKARIPENADVQLLRFLAERYAERGGIK